MEITPGTHRESFLLLCDERIGGGMSREVYSSKLLPDCVVKIEQPGGFFQNIVEWETWQRVKYTEHSRWFAECKWISPNGSVLIMERTRPAAPSERPDSLPVFLTDFKATNFGMVSSVGKNGSTGKDWFVCHDYGTNMLFERGMVKRMRKVDWSDRT